MHLPILQRPTQITMSITYTTLVEKLQQSGTTLVAVSKTKPVSAIQELYDKGQRIFGENRVQEMATKYDELPKDISWHMIGHLQSNKVKYMAHFVDMIHSVDNEKLLHTIDQQAAKHNRSIDILLQIKIAAEDSKSGWEFDTLMELLSSDVFQQCTNIRVRGVMGMATFTDDTDQVRSEFRKLRQYYEQLSAHLSLPHFDTVSMGMSGDYPIAIAEGSTMVRIGSLLFGARSYPT